MDKLAATGAIFFLIVLAGFLVVFAMQYKNLTANGERLIILVTRTSMFLPLYSFFMLIALAAPKALAAVSIPIAFIEGYSFYCYLTAVVTNLGGPAKAVEALQGRPLFCCTSQCPTDPDKFYNKVTWTMFHFVAYRPVVVILAAICDYAKSKVGQLLYLLLNLVAFAILVRSLLHFVLFYEAVYEKSKNLKGILKAMLLKFTVGLIVLQGLIAQFLIIAKAEPYNDDNDWNKEDKTNRGYCLLVLLEFVLLQVPYLIAFVPTIVPAFVPENPAAPKAPDLCRFIFQILCIHDIFGYLAYKDEAQQDLASNMK